MKKSISPLERMEGLEYNSEKDRLVIPEYGRNVQNLIRHARAIEDIDERIAFTDKVVELIMQMHPQNRNLDDYRDKMWKHVFRIADYNLPGIVPPNGMIPKPENHRKKPEVVDYPKVGRKFRHYGNNVQLLIDKAIKMEEGPVKNGFVETIGSYMKLAYRTWNKEHYISDEVIVEDLESLSKGKLTLVEDAKLDGLTQSNMRRRRNAMQRGGSGGRDRDDYRRDRGGDRGGRRGGGRRDGGRGGYRDDRDNRGGGRNNYRNKRR